ncbi:MAG: hypothetical protein ACAI38_09010 [Myxococcota bacterium]
MRRYTLMALLAAAACSDGLDEVEDVRDLRVLALRADPPEVFVDQDPQAIVTFSALVVDPRQAPLATTPIDYAFQFCPVESNEGCLDYDKRRAEASEESRPLLDGLRGLAEDGIANSEAEARSLTPAEASERGAWPYAILPFTLALTPTETQNLAIYFFETNRIGLGMGSLPSVSLAVSGADDAFTAEKRFVFNVANPGAAAAQLGVDFGYPVCESGEDESAGCVALRPRVRNSNPSFDRIQVSLGALANGEFADVQSTGFTMRGSSVIRILPVMTGDSYEPFQELVTNPSTGRISARDLTEVISVSWFATAGDLQDPLTTPLYTKSLDTEYRSPPIDAVPPEGMMVSVFMVARDQRGGVAWQNLEIFVTK